MWVQNLTPLIGNILPLWFIDINFRGDTSRTLNHKQLNLIKIQKSKEKCYKGN